MPRMQPLLKTLLALRAIPKPRLLHSRSLTIHSRPLRQPQHCVLSPISRSLWFSSTSSSESQSPSISPIKPPPKSTPTAHHKPPTSRPEYELTFTCKPCSTRSAHRVSKQGYHHGSVLITCPECRNRHVISDHLGIFGDRNLTIEDLMREQGQLVKKGTLSEDGDLEFWADGTQTKRPHSKPGASQDEAEK